MLLACLAASLVLAGSVATFSAFSRCVLHRVERRRGLVRLADPVLARLPGRARDFSRPIALLVAAAPAGLLLELLAWRRDPRAVVVFVGEYALLLWVKALTLWLTPLEVPVGFKPLRDPLLDWVTGGRGGYGRDLMFSGHVGFYVLGVCTTAFKGVYLLGTGVMATLLLLQRAHYAVDVVVAGFVAYGCHSLVAMLSLPSSSLPAPSPSSSSSYWPQT